MTREEAKAKWCPNYQVSIAETDNSRAWTRDNRGRVEERNPNCIAERCMAWVERAGYNGEMIGKCGLVRG